MCRDGSGNERPFGIRPPNDGGEEGMRGEGVGKMERATRLREREGGREGGGKSGREYVG